MALSDSEKVNKIKGMLWGALLGDSYGSLFEFVKRPDMPVLNRALTQELYATPGIVNVFGCPLGTITDDGIQIMITIESLLEHDLVLDNADIKQKFVRWVEDGYWTPNGVCFDVGRATLHGLGLLRYRSSANPANIKMEGNGSLMRLPAIAALDHLKTSSLLSFIQITHKSKEPWFYQEQFKYLRLIRKILRDEPYDDIAAREVNHLDDPLYEPTGDVASTVNLAITVLEHGPDDFVDGLNKVVSYGNDTDTNACVYGALKGAAIGHDRLPQWMMKGMWRRKRIGIMIDEFAKRIVDWG